MIRDHAESSISTPIYQWKEKFLTIPTENQTPLFLTKNHLDLCDTFGVLMVVYVCYFAYHVGLNVVTLSPNSDWRNIQLDSQ